MYQMFEVAESVETPGQLNILFYRSVEETITRIESLQVTRNHRATPVTAINEGAANYAGAQKTWLTLIVVRCLGWGGPTLNFACLLQLTSNLSASILEFEMVCPLLKEASDLEEDSSLSKFRRIATILRYCLLAEFVFSPALPHHPPSNDRPNWTILVVSRCRLQTLKQNPMRIHRK